MSAPRVRLLVALPGVGATMIALAARGSIGGTAFALLALSGVASVAAAWAPGRIASPAALLSGFAGLVGLHLCHESPPFPYVDWMRGLGLDWIQLKPLGSIARNPFGFTQSFLLFGLLYLLSRPRPPRVASIVAGTLATWLVVQPQPFMLHDTGPPTPADVPTPMVYAGAPTERTWLRNIGLDGIPIRLGPAMLRAEDTLAAVGHGVFAGQRGERFRGWLWTVQRKSAALTWIVRLAIGPVALAWSLVNAWRHLPVARSLVRAAVLGLLLVPEALNAAFVLVMVAARMPDVQGRALLMASWNVTWIGLVAVVAMAGSVGRPAGPGATGSV